MSDPVIERDQPDGTDELISDTTGALLLDSIIPYQINRLSHRMNRLLDQELRTQGISISDWRVMAVLDFNSAVSVNELASYAMIEQSTLSRLLQRMEARGILEIRQAKTDGRMRMIVLTQEGRQRYEAVRKITLKHVGRVVRGLDKAERVLLSKLIQRMRDNVETLDLQ